MSNELLGKYASEVFAGRVAPLEGVKVSAPPAEDALAKENVLVRMNRELARAGKARIGTAMSDSD